MRHGADIDLRHDGLRMVDVDNPGSAYIAGGYSGEGEIGDVVVADGYAYLVDVEGTVLIVDAANPSGTVLGRFRDPVLKPWSVVVQGNYAYVAAGSGGAGRRGVCRSRIRRRRP
jgi:hypothetical protein